MSHTSLLLACIIWLFRSSTSLTLSSRQNVYEVWELPLWYPHSNAYVNLASEVLKWELSHNHNVRSTCHMTLCHTPLTTFGLVWWLFRSWCYHDHCDLAARNIMAQEDSSGNMHSKVEDFGLSRCVCMCVCVCVCVCVCACVCVCSTYTCVFCMCVCVRLYMCMCLYILCYIYTCVCVCVCVCRCAYCTYIQYIGVWSYSCVYKLLHNRDTSIPCIHSTKHLLWRFGLTDPLHSLLPADMCTLGYTLLPLSGRPALCLPSGWPSEVTDRLCFHYPIGCVVSHDVMLMYVLQ